MRDEILEALSGRFRRAVSDAGLPGERLVADVCDAMSLAPEWVPVVERAVQRIRARMWLDSVRPLGLGIPAIERRMRTPECREWFGDPPDDVLRGEIAEWATPARMEESLAREIIEPLLAEDARTERTPPGPRRSGRTIRAIARLVTEMSEQPGLRVLYVGATAAAVRLAHARARGLTDSASRASVCDGRLEFHFADGVAHFATLETLARWPGSARYDLVLVDTDYDDPGTPVGLR